MTLNFSTNTLSVEGVMKKLAKQDRDERSLYQDAEEWESRQRLFVQTCTFARGTGIQRNPNTHHQFENKESKDEWQKNGNTMEENKK